MENFYQSSLRRTINSNIYQKPTVDVVFAWVQYQAILREKKIWHWSVRWMQILGVSRILDHNKEELQSQLRALARKHNVFFIQLWCVDILTKTTTLSPEYITHAIALREQTTIRYKKLWLHPSPKENLPPSTYLINTTLSELEARNTLSSHHRTKIKKAQKASIDIREAISPAEKTAFYLLLQSTGSTKWFGTISQEKYTALTDRCSANNIGKVYIALYQHRIVGGALYLIDQDTHTATYLYGGTDRSIGNIGASHYMHRAIMRDLHSQNISCIDLLGGGPTWYPHHHLAHVWALKEGFGWEKRDYHGSFDYIHNRFLYCLWSMRQ
jgi:Acetyltransferase (GNAT) domain